MRDVRDLEIATAVQQGSFVQVEPTPEPKVSDDAAAVENFVHIDYAGENIVRIDYRLKSEPSHKTSASHSDARRAAANLWDQDLGIVSAETPVPDLDSRLLGTWHCSMSDGLNVDALSIVAHEGHMTIDVLVPCEHERQSGTSRVPHLTGTLEPVGAMGVSNLCFESIAFPVEGGERSGLIRVRVDLKTGLLYFSHRLFGAPSWSSELKFFSLESDLDGEIQRFARLGEHTGSGESNCQSAFSGGAGRRLPAKSGWSPCQKSCSSTSSSMVQDRYLRPVYSDMGPGTYYVADDHLPVTTGIRASFDSVLCELSRGTLVRVLEVQHCLEQRTIRGRISEPPGWIPLRNVENGHTWVLRSRNFENVSRPAVEQLLAGCTPCLDTANRQLHFSFDGHHDLGSKIDGTFRDKEFREPFRELVGECSTLPTCSASGDGKELIRVSCFDEPLP